MRKSHEEDPSTSVNAAIIADDATPTVRFTPDRLVELQTIIDAANDRLGLPRTSPSATPSQGSESAGLPGRLSSFMHGVRGLFHRG